MGSCASDREISMTLKFGPAMAGWTAGILVGGLRPKNCMCVFRWVLVPDRPTSIQKKNNIKKVRLQ